MTLWGIVPWAVIVTLALWVIARRLKDLERDIAAVKDILDVPKTPDVAPSAVPNPGGKP